MVLAICIAAGLAVVFGVTAITGHVQLWDDDVVGWLAGAAVVCAIAFVIMGLVKLDMNDNATRDQIKIELNNMGYNVDDVYHGNNGWTAYVTRKSNTFCGGYISVVVKKDNPIQIVSGLSC